MGKGFGELFGDTFNEYIKKFFPILKIFVFLYLIPLVVVSIFLLILFAGTFSSLGISVLKTGSFGKPDSRFGRSLKGGYSF